MRDGNEPVEEEEEVEQGKMLAAQIIAKTCSLNLRKACGMLILPQCFGMLYIYIYISYQSSSSSAHGCQMKRILSSSLPSHYFWIFCLGEFDKYLANRSK